MNSRQVAGMALGDFNLAGCEVRRSRGVVSRIVLDEAIVVPIRSGAGAKGSVYTLNQAATTIWAMIEAGRSATDMAACLQSEYEVSAEQAVADTKEFLEELAEAGLVELVC